MFCTTRAKSSTGDVFACVLLASIPASGVAIALLLPSITQAGELEKLDNPNVAFMVEATEGSVPFDVELAPDTDLDAFTREYLGFAPDAYVTPLIIPAADANADSQISPYFFSFGSGTYSYTTNSSCHMAPAYLPFTRLGTTVTVNNFYIFAFDNNASFDTAYNLWRKDTLSTAAPQLMGTASTTGAATTIQVNGDTSIDYPIVANQYVYYIAWCFSGPDVGIQGFWIYYTESSPA